MMVADVAKAQTCQVLKTWQVFVYLTMQALEPDRFYHIYNRGNNKQDIFFEKDNYFHFLRLIKKHLPPIADIYCYCLLKNHFHLLVRIKEDAVAPSKKFSNLFNAYTKAINKKYHRTGSLFQKPFRRVSIENETYLRNLVLYIHLNPEHHGIISNFEKYQFSSYSGYISDENMNPLHTQIIDLFEDRSNFTAVHHRRKNNLEQISNLILE